MTIPVLVLLAEDDPQIVTVMEAALGDAGYEVIVARDGNAALREIEADAARFRAVATDIKLGPGPDGWEIAQRVRALVPTMPLVYMTGDTAQEWASKGVPGSIILTKPFAPAQLVTAIASLCTQADMQASVAGSTPTAPD